MKVEAPIVPLRGHTWADNDVDLFFFYFPSSFDAPSERRREIEKRAKFPTLLYSRDMGKYTRLALLSIILYIERERKTRNKRERGL